MFHVGSRVANEGVKVRSSSAGSRVAHKKDKPSDGCKEKKGLTRKKELANEQTDPWLL